MNGKFSDVQYWWWERCRYWEGNIVYNINGREYGPFADINLNNAHAESIQNDKKYPWRIIVSDKKGDKYVFCSGLMNGPYADVQNSSQNPNVMIVNKPGGGQAFILTSDGRQIDIDTGYYSINICHENFPEIQGIEYVYNSKRYLYFKGISYGPYEYINPVFSKDGRKAVFNGKVFDDYSQIPGDYSDKMPKYTGIYENQYIEKENNKYGPYDGIDKYYVSDNAKLWAFKVYKKDRYYYVINGSEFGPDALGMELWNVSGKKTLFWTYGDGKNVYLSDEVSE